MSFERAMDFVFDAEGGFVDDPRDAGGMTNMGISSASHSDLDIRGLTRENALTVYRDCYWGPSGASKLPWPANAAVLDYAVHSGTRRAVEALQTVVNSVPDGVFGPKTDDACKTYLVSKTPVDLANAVTNLRGQFLAQLCLMPKFKCYANGWTNRLERLKMLVNQEDTLQCP